MTLSQIVYEIRERYKLMNDDSWPQNAYIEYLVNNARAVVMQQRYSDPRNIPASQEYQAITDTLDSTGMSNRILPAIIRTSNINTSLKVHGYTTSTQGYDINKAIQFNVVPFDRLPYVGASQFTSDLIYCALTPEMKIVLNSGNDMHKLIDKIYIRGLFENPVDAYLQSLIDGFTQYTYEQYVKTEQYPISNSILLDVNKIVDAKMEKLLSITKDTLNDGTEERLDKNPQGNV